jgi:hypothetical protein
LPILADAAGIARITNFTDLRVFALTGLPQVLT